VSADPGQDPQPLTKVFAPFRRSDNPFVVDYWEAWRVDRNEETITDPNSIINLNTKLGDGKTTTFSLIQGAGIQLPGGIGGQQVTDMYLQTGFPTTDPNRKWHGTTTYQGSVYYIDGLGADELPKGLKAGIMMQLFNQYPFGLAPAGVIRCMPAEGNEQVMRILLARKDIQVSDPVAHSIRVGWSDEAGGTTDFLAYKFRSLTKGEIPVLPPP
jgi:hypothetical protein